MGKVSGIRLHFFNLRDGDDGPEWTLGPFEGTGMNSPTVIHGLLYANGGEEYARCEDGAWFVFGDPYQDGYTDMNIDVVEMDDNGEGEA